MRTLKTSTITIFTRSSDSSSVCWTNSATRQMLPGVLAERQHLAGVALLTLWAGALSDRLSSPCKGPNRCQTSRENGDGADGSFKRSQERSLDFHTEVTCARTFQTLSCET